MNSSKQRLGHNLTNSASKLKLDSINKILKIDSVKGKRQRKDAIVKQVSRIALTELMKNSPQRSQMIAPDFKTFLLDEDNIEVFMEFLKASYCQENLNFYLACEIYRRLDPSRVGKQMIKFMAIQIYNDFLSEDAREQVNVESGCREHIKKALEDPQPDLFRDAQAEIFNLMKTDCYPRFCRTWQLDKNLAQKILSKSSRTKLQEQPSQSAAISFATTHEPGRDCIHGSFSSQALSMSSSSTLSSRSRTPSRESRTPTSRSHTSSSSHNTTQCPPECPYFRIGRLPCQEHRIISAVGSQTGALKRPRDVGLGDDVIDLKRIHQVPELCARRKRSPPAPPLPPKPRKIDQNQTGLAPQPIDPYLPYVGKVFHV